MNPSRAVRRLLPLGASIVVLAAIVAPAAGAAGTPKVAVYVTTADGRSTIDRRPDVRFRSGRGSGPDAIVVRPGVGYQRLTAGFGVAMTDTAAWLMRTQLPDRLRDRAMSQLFTFKAGGLGLSYLRVPIGGSDYIVGKPYTYDDRPPGQTDPTLAHFSVRHDRAYIFPALRQALALNPRMTVMANTWSAPAWMKTDDSIIPTSKTGSALGTGDYGAFARYLVKVTEAYRTAGVPVDQLGVQNEPLNTYLTRSFPQMLLPAAGEAQLVNHDLAPALRRAGLDPQLLIWDFAYPKTVPALAGLFPAGALDYVDQVARSVGSNADGIALHCYFSDAGQGSVLHRRYPRLAQYETECASYLSQIQPAQMAIRVLRNWAQGVQLWNAAVDQNFGPKVGQGCAGIFGPHAGQQCIAPLIVNRQTRTFTHTSDFWQLGQFSRFIQLDARRIASTTPSDCHDGTLPLAPCGLEDVAFRNPDGSRVLVATTNDGRAKALRVTEGQRHFTYRLPDGATATFVWH